MINVHSLTNSHHLSHPDHSRLRTIPKPGLTPRPTMCATRSTKPSTRATLPLKRGPIAITSIPRLTLPTLSIESRHTKRPAPLLLPPLRAIICVSSAEPTGAAAVAVDATAGLLAAGSVGGDAPCGDSVLRVTARAEARLAASAAVSSGVTAPSARGAAAAVIVADTGSAYGGAALAVGGHWGSEGLVLSFFEDDVGGGEEG